MKKEISIFHNFKQGPYGGANQFMVALETELISQGYVINRNSISSHTKLVLLNSFLFDANLLRKSLERYPDVTVAHRIDGPVEDYRGKKDGADSLIFSLNKEFADVTIFQSYYSYSKHIQKGLNMTNPVVISNAASQYFGKSTDNDKKGDKTRIVATSWSTNMQKGSLYYQWIDKHIDRNKYEFTFIGNSNHKFENSNHIEALPPKELARELKNHDIYITASKNDPCSNSLIEAVSCGLPAVYMNSGGHSEIVNGNGVAFTTLKDLGTAIDKCSRERLNLQKEIHQQDISTIAGEYVKTSDHKKNYYSGVIEKSVSVILALFFRFLRKILSNKKSWQALRKKVLWNLLFMEQSFKEQLYKEEQIDCYGSDLNIPCDDIFNAIEPYISKSDILLNINPDYINVALRVSRIAKHVYSFSNILSDQEKQVIGSFKNFNIIEEAESKYQNSVTIFLDAFNNDNSAKDFIKKANSCRIIVMVRSEQGKEFHLRKQLGLNPHAIADKVKSFNENEIIRTIIESGYMISDIKYTVDNRILCYAEKIEKSTENKPVVSYGNIEINSKKVITGGKVKLIHLNEAFPQSLYRFNILYIVATALPKLYYKELIIAAKQKGIRIVLNQNGIGFFGWAGKQTNRVNEKLKFLYGQADYILFQSEFSRKSSEEFLGINNKPWDIAYNCVDTDKFKPLPGNTTNKSLSLLAIGSHHERERVFLAIDTAAELKAKGVNCELVICGRFIWSSFGEEEVQEYIILKQVEHITTIKKEYTQQEAVEIYQNADILLHLKYKDPCPTVPIEAMACGLPVVCSNSGGMPELVKDAGELINVPDSWNKLHYPAIDEIVASVLKIKNDYKSYSEKARNNVVNHFTKQKWIQQHQEVFTKVLEQK